MGREKRTLSGENRLGKTPEVGRNMANSINQKWMELVIEKTATQLDKKEPEK